jgi:coenzyme PQQ precursor peptide PqqA
VNLLIPRGFDAGAAQFRDVLLRRSNRGGAVDDKKFHWRTFNQAVVYWRGRISSGSEKETQMAWKTPKIVEVPVGMEINMYACAARK